MSSANTPQGSADRAEELNRICELPDLEFGREFALRELVYRVSSELAEDDEAWMSQLEAEWDRRCAERKREEPGEHLGCGDYTGEACPSCGRTRIMMDSNWWRRCEKCHGCWNSEAWPEREAQAAELERLRAAVAEYHREMEAPVKCYTMTAQRRRELFGLVEPQPQEAREVVGIDLARPGSGDRSAVAVRNPDGTVHVEVEEASEGQEELR